MANNQSKSPAQEWWTKTVGTIVDVWNYFRDRAKILATSGAAILTPGALKISPFLFAILSVVVPTLFVDGALALWKTFRDLPSTQLERRISSDKEIETISHKAASPLDDPLVSKHENESDDKLSDAELKAEIDRLIKERDAGKPRPQLTLNEQAQYDKRQNRIGQLAIESAKRALRFAGEVGLEGERLFRNERIFLQAILKFSNLEQSYWLVMVGASLVLNASLFGYLVRRKPVMFPNSDGAQALYLYAVGSLLLFPHAVAAILNATADLAVRFDWDKYLEYHNVLIMAVGVWGLFQLRKAATMMSAQMAYPSGGSVKARNIVANRLVVSQAGTFLLIQVVLAIIGIPAFFLILRFQK